MANREPEGRHTSRGQGGLLATFGSGALLALAMSRSWRLGVPLAAGSVYLAYRGLAGPRTWREVVDGLPRLDLARGRVQVARAVTIDRPRPELYRLWRDFSNLPGIMQHLESVEVIDERRSRWTAESPLGGTVTWEAEVVDEVADEHVAWRSLPDSDVETRGRVQFRDAPGGRGTEVHVTLEYTAPGGRMAAGMARLLGRDPDSQIREDLRRLKRVLETGEDATTEGQPSGREAIREPRRRRARGSEEPSDVEIGAETGEATPDAPRSELAGEEPGPEHESAAARARSSASHAGEVARAQERGGTGVREPEQGGAS
ncbi:MAG: SRPBCC family protein [Candidatus Krumholzibacteriia bacterium]